MAYPHKRVADLNGMMCKATDEIWCDVRACDMDCLPYRMIKNIGSATGGGVGGGHQAVYYLPYKGRALLRKVIKRNKWE